MVRTKELDQFSNAAWSEGVRRERVIAPLARRSRATQAEIERAAEKLGLGTAMVFRLVARYRRERNTSENSTLGERTQKPCVWPKLYSLAENRYTD